MPQPQYLRVTIVLSLVGILAIVGAIIAPLWDGSGYANFSAHPLDDANTQPDHALDYGQHYTLVVEGLWTDEGDVVPPLTTQFWTVINPLTTRMFSSMRSHCRTRHSLPGVGPRWTLADDSHTLSALGSRTSSVQSLGPGSDQL